jgi:hypothetical protein
MRISSGVRLFIGLKVDQKLREQLEACSDLEKRYFAAGDPRFLTFVDGEGGARYLGRTLESSLSTDELDDLRRNVVSILGKIAPSVRPERALMIFPCSEAPPATSEPLPDDPDRSLG